MDVEPVELGAYPPEEEYPPSIVNGFSGCMLCINCSTGIVAGGLAADVLAPGVGWVAGFVGFVMGMLEFGGRNCSG